MAIMDTVNRGWMGSARGSRNLPFAGPIDPVLDEYLRSLYRNGANNVTPPAANNSQQQTATPSPTATPAPAATPAPPAPPQLTPEQKLEQDRVNFINQATQGFGTNYGKTLISDNLLDDTINSILNEQRGGAQQYLDRGLARGIFNDTGYQAGLGKLSTSADTARASLATLGNDVLSKYRTEANDVRDRAFSNISGLLPGQSFSLDPYFAEGSGIQTRAQQNAGGDLRGALGGTNYFNFSDLTNTAGQAQGAANLRDADVATAIAERNRRSSQGRGLGSQGSF